MPDAKGNFKGIAVPRIPWHEDEHERPEHYPGSFESACETCPDPITCSGIGCHERAALDRD